MRPLVSDVMCDVSPPRPHLSALVMTGREARLGTDTELDERKFRNNLSQLIGDFRRIFQNIIHFVGVRVSQYDRRRVSTQRNVSFENNCLQADKENLIFSSPHDQLS